MYLKPIKSMKYFIALVLPQVKPVLASGFCLLLDPGLTFPFAPEVSVSFLSASPGGAAAVFLAPPSQLVLIGSS